MAINPSQQVPTLIAENGTLKLTQSIAILDYLEERYPDKKPLYPKDLRGRCIVRNLVMLISADVQPIANLRILEHIDTLGSSKEEWAKDYLQKGLYGITALFV